MANNKFIRNIKINASLAGATADAPGKLDLLHVGTWFTPWHGDFETTEADIHEYVKHFQEGVGLPEDNDGEAQVNYSHESHKKAGGWMSNLRAEEIDGRLHLVADFVPTPAGAQAIKDKEFKYISPEFNPRALPWEDPEEEWRLVANVITGAGLTNIPLFKKLKKVAASERPEPKGSSNQSKQGDSMSLEDVRIKENRAITADERAFLEEHKSELTEDELQKFAIQADAKPQGDKKVEGDGKVATIDASELASLRAAAQQGVEAAQKLAQKEASDFASARIEAGQVKSEQKDALVKMLLEASSEDARKSIEDFVSGLPENERLVDAERGVNASTGSSAADELEEKAQKIVADSKGKKNYTQAMKEVLASDADLRSRVEADRK